MQSYKLIPLAAFLLLVACAPTLPVKVEPEGYTSRPVSERIQDLEAAASQLREQQLAMGQSLIWIEGQIKAMRYQEAHEGRAAAAPPAPVAAPTHLPVDPPAPIESPSPTPEKHSEAAPTPLVPEAPAAAVSALSDEDMEVEPGQPHKDSATALPSGFAVHLASYTHQEQLARGWREIKQQGSASLEGLKPFGSAFTDTRGREWLRLNVGPFETRRAAAARCAEIKTTGTFCDVQEVRADGVIAVN